MRLDRRFGDVELVGDLLVKQSFGDGEAVQWLQRRKLPIVSVDLEPDPAATSIRLDERAGGSLVARHLRDLGHTDIAVFTIDPDRPEPGWLTDASATLGNHVADERLRGVAEELAREGLRPRVFTVKDNLDRMIDLGARALIADDARPTAVVCFSDLMAAAVVAAAQAAGLRVPGDLSVVGYDDTRLAAAVSPPLTTVRQDFVAKGQAAARALIAAMDAAQRGEPVPAEDIIVPVELVVRESTGRPRGRA